jgi:cytochrome c oxidase assembly protein subunit 15
MADGVFAPSSEPKAWAEVHPLPMLRRFVYGLALATIMLMAVGSATRVMNAGLACPDWPLCYGTVMPAAQMNLQVFLEWFHRLIASSLGFAMIGLTGVVWFYRRRLPAWLPIAVTASLGLIVVQGVLGGLTVTQLLRFDIVTAHLGVGLLFFGSMVVLSGLLTPYSGTIAVHHLHRYSLGAATCVYCQSLLGALVASRWAVHQCLDTAKLCQILSSHRLSAIPVSLAVLLLVYRVWRTPTLTLGLRRLAQVALIFLTVQVAIGISTLRLHLQVEWLTVSHQIVAALLFGSLVLFSVFALREQAAAACHSDAAVTDSISAS